MNPVSEELRAKLRRAPEGPGIYIHFGKNRKVLYVGKAKNLRNRLKSYFYSSAGLPERTRRLVSQIVDFAVILVQTENEALILESQYIRSHKPPYNILLQDDKAYPYVRIQTSEEWPRVRMVRSRRQDGALYFGPFAGGGQMDGVLAVIRRYFPLVKCTPHVFRTVPRPCNYHAMGQCLAPCHLDVSKKEYEQHLNSVVELLKGRVGHVARDIKRLMAAASERMDYEQAAVYRDQLMAIDRLRDAQSVEFPMHIDADVIGIFWANDRFAFHVSGVRGGRLATTYGTHSTYELENPEQTAQDDESFTAHGRQQVRASSVLALLKQYYQRSPEQVRILIADPEEIWGERETHELEVFLRILSGKTESCAEVHAGLESFLHAVSRGSQEFSRKTVKNTMQSAFEGLQRTAQLNARHVYQEAQKVSTQAENLLLGLQTFLSLNQPPVWLECFDISNFQGQEVVASQVVFLDGRPAPRRYRKYIIRSVEGQDDFGSLREVIRRRFRDAAAQEIPDLLLIDGGEPQVREVLKVLKTQSLEELKVVGIAKSRTRRSFVHAQVSQTHERLVVPVISQAGVKFETRELPVGSPEYRLVTQARDEAHRVAVNFHRQRRSQASMRSAFVQVTGLGPKRLRRLRSVYGKPDLMLADTEEEIILKTGFPRELVKRLLDAHHTSGESESPPASPR